MLSCENDDIQSPSVIICHRPGKKKYYKKLRKFSKAQRSKIQEKKNDVI